MYEAETNKLLGTQIRKNRSLEVLIQWVGSQSSWWVNMSSWHRIRRNHTNKKQCKVFGNGKSSPPPSNDAVLLGEIWLLGELQHDVTQNLKHLNCFYCENWIKSWVDHIESYLFNIIFPCFRSHSLEMTIISISIYRNIFKYIYIYMIESSPAASLRGLIGHELQCLQRNVWDRRFSAERCVGFEASYFSYNCFVKMDASNPCFFSVHVFVVPLYVWYYFLPIHHSLWSADCLGDSFALKKMVPCLSSKVGAQLIWDAMVARGVRKAGQYLGNLQKMMVRRGDNTPPYCWLDNTWSPSFCWYLPPKMNESPSRNEISQKEICHLPHTCFHIALKFPSRPAFFTFT